jgi:mono/diheme cytochrome c family protein/5-hydroxyisourate hydrolase-like protein (transthyretin family)
MEKLMPPWEKRLSDEQIWDVLYYVRSLSLSPAYLSAGQDVYAANCAECHGEDGVSDEIDLSQPALLVGKSDKMLFDDLRADQTTHAALSDLSDEELWQSLAALRSLSQNTPSFEGVLHGQVINASTDQPAANVDLLLYVLSQSGVMQTIPGVSDAEGRFTFENLSTEHAIQYGLKGDYNNISYFSAEPIVFLPDTTVAQATLNVYDTTEDPGAVSQSNMHRIIDLVPGLMHVVDVYVFSNSGNATYIGQAGADGQPVTVKIALPKEASNVNYQSQTLRMVEDGIYVDSEAITPGEGSYELVVTYEIPLDKKTLTLETPHFYDVETINILAADRGEVIKSEQLSAKEPTTIQGDTFLMLTGSNLKADQPLVMEFSKLNKLEMSAPPGDSPHGTKSFSPTSINARNVPEGPDQNILMWGILGLGLLAIIFTLVYVSRQQPSSVAAASQAILAQEQNRLLARLSELEALHQTGEIDDQTYQRLKHKNRTLLKQILAQLENGS